MQKLYYETFREISSLGIHLAYRTTPGGYRPLHWHDELEILFPLNGDADIFVEGHRQHLPQQSLMVIDSRQVHSTYAKADTYMFVCIHISKRGMQEYLPDVELYQVRCMPEEITEEQRPAYEDICHMLENLTRLYVDEPVTFLMESEGIILQIFSRLIRFFSTNTAPQSSNKDMMTMERLREVITYVEKHFQEPVTLQDMADLLGIGKEYFCRFFKKNMGMSFLQYVNEVRITHIYQDLIHTDTPVYELMEENGFTNQKLFNKTFRTLYGCTPSAVRKNGGVPETTESSS